MEEHAQRQEQKKYLELAIFARPEQLEQARVRQEERKKQKTKKQAEEIKARQIDPRLRQVLHCVAIRRAILAEDARALRIAFKEADPLLMHNLTRDSAGLTEQMEKGAEGAQKAFVSAVKARIDQEKELVEALGIELEDGRRMRRGETLSKARMAQLHERLLK